MKREVTAQYYGIVQSLQQDYWNLVDGRSDCHPKAIFTADACFSIGSTELSGLPAIEAFLKERARTAEGRVTRHFATGLRLEALDDGLSATSTICVYAGTGAIPFATLTPNAICDVDDLCVQTPEGWRIARRSIQVVFAGDGAASFVKSSTD